MHSVSPAQRYLESLRDEAALRNLWRVLVESNSSAELAALGKLYERRTCNVAELDQLYRGVVKLLVRHFSSIRTRPPTLEMVQNSGLRIARLILLARGYRSDRGPKTEIKAFADGCKAAERDGDAVCAANLECDLSFYAQDFLQQFSGQRYFPNFWFQRLDGQLVVSSDQLRYAAQVAEQALTSPALDRRPSMPLHDELVWLIQFELRRVTGSRAKGATKRLVSTGPNSEEHLRSGAVFTLIRELGALVGLDTLVTEKHDVRMRKSQKPTVNLSTLRRPRISWKSR